MLVNGFSPANPIPEQKAALDKEKQLAEKKAAAAAASQAEKKPVAEEKQMTPEERAEKAARMEQSDYQLKELLFLMTSRGNQATVEKLAKVLKKEKETLN